MRRSRALFVFVLLCFAAVFLFCGCGAAILAMMPGPEEKPAQTQLQVREVQTREYDTDDYKMVMKAVLNTLQDDGYVVKNANTDLGLLQATKEIDIMATSQGRKEAVASAIFGGIIGAPRAIYAQNTVRECSANVSQFGNKTRVRLNFCDKVFDNHGAVLRTELLSDPKFYQDIFSKMGKGIFIGKQRI